MVACWQHGNQHERPFSSLTQRQRPRLLILANPAVTSTRALTGLVPTLVRGVLKIRYLLLGGALGGGYNLAKHYEEWKAGLPDTDWIKGLMPDMDVAKYRTSLVDAANKIKGKANELDIGE